MRFWFSNPVNDKIYIKYAYRGGSHKFGSRKSPNCCWDKVWWFIRLYNNIPHSFSNEVSPNIKVTGTLISAENKTNIDIK